MNSTLLLRFSKFVVRKYFSGMRCLLFPVKEGFKVFEKWGTKVEGQGVADLFRDTAFDPK